MTSRTDQARSRTRTAEVTSFRMKRGITADQAVEAGRDIDAWLRQQPGFVSRIMISNLDGSITDIVVWRTVQDGRSSSERLMAETAGSRFHVLVDAASVDWTFATVLI